MQIGNGLQFSLTIGEQPVDLFKVFDFEVREALSEIFSLTISAFSQQSGIAAADLLEQGFVLP